jgi:hypothetical protein
MPSARLVALAPTSPPTPPRVARSGTAQPAFWEGLAAQLRAAAEQGRLKHWQADDLARVAWALANGPGIQVSEPLGWAGGGVGWGGGGAHGSCGAPAALPRVAEERRRRGMGRGSF